MKILTAARSSILGLIFTASANVAPAAEMMPTAPAVSVGPSAQFTFNVPVQLHSIREENNALAVHCSVGRRAAGDWIGAGRQTAPLDAGGNFMGTVTVKVNVDRGRDPTEADVYRCGLYLIGRAESTPCPPEAASCVAAWLRAKSGTPFRSFVEGSIP
jgi:hypothetical protein